MDFQKRIELLWRIWLWAFILFGLFLIGLGAVFIARLVLSWA
jgi:hypothetical protein